MTNKRCSSRNEKKNQWQEKVLCPPVTVTYLHPFLIIKTTLNTCCCQWTEVWWWKLSGHTWLEMKGRTAPGTCHLHQCSWWTSENTIDSMGLKRRRESIHLSLSFFFLSFFSSIQSFELELLYFFFSTQSNDLPFIFSPCLLTDQLRVVQVMKKIHSFDWKTFFTKIENESSEKI